MSVLISYQLGEYANVGVQVACAEGISDLCQKNAEVVDPVKCTVEGPGLEQKLLKSENQPSSQSALCGKMANSVVKSKVLWPG